MVLALVILCLFLLTCIPSLTGGDHIVGMMLVHLGLSPHRKPQECAGVIASSGGVGMADNARLPTNQDLRWRQLLQAPDSVIPINITYPHLLTYLGELHPESADPAWNISLKEDLDLSPNHKTLFYHEKEAGASTSHLLMRATQSTSINGSLHASEHESDESNFSRFSWNISQFAGPFTNVSGLLVVDETSVLVSFRSENLIRKINVTSGVELSSMTVREPYTLAKDPQNKTFFIASTDSIIVVSMDSLENTRILAGPSIRDTDNGSFADSSTGAEARFHGPSIGPESLSWDGIYLYVADQNNQVIRRVNTVTGATETIAGQKGNEIGKDGPPL
ncbi:hypothetical protein CBR_g701 [Chara braunii]|uniref:SMP-30/Gluconolactonase/LRE-like region domain-containing protein n=1 Tax=Chara braunii TaxID=69332 RepID=A0A388KBY1_CHABU|nr:hypothetical protein CBR_g701 [Chara braunii]|eukprot:GBG67572.1 hypothetical protein CBR_g701 [Chara braunii]